MEEFEEATCLGSFKLSSAGREARHFVIGSENLARSDTTPVLAQGRIRVYRVISEHDIELVASLAVSGCVSSLASIDGKIVACIGSAVCVSANTSLYHTNFTFPSLQYHRSLYTN
jgi:CPSF A subunit region